MPSKALNRGLLSQLSIGDQERFIDQGFGRREPIPFECVHHAFEHHVRSQPHAVAVEHLADSITYAELDRKATLLASHLSRAGIRVGSRVLLLAERSIPFVIGILAILKSGAAYIPLDGSITTDSTLAHIMQDSGAKLSLCMRAFIHRVQDTPNMCLEDVIESEDDRESELQPGCEETGRTDGVYIIYTSGTTGKPKGVDVTHGNVTNLICLAPGNLEMRPGLRVSQLLNIAFDMAQWEILGALSNGCTLCIRGRRSYEWKAVLRTVDVVIATPSILAPHDPADYPNIKVIATAGEVCPQALADRWSRSASFYNSCGPTEITIVNTVQLHEIGAKLSIGTPTPNNNVYILDEDLKPVPFGEPGVMWAGGAGITRGYLNLQEKTAERYRRDPFADNGSHMFNTGDLGRWRPDGQLDHLGRVDDQVKVKGFRVELDGVSASMRACPGVELAVTLLIGSELWAFLTPAGIDGNIVKAHTAQIQPYYAVPSQYLSLTHFPHTSNGKVDKRALREIAENSRSQPVDAALVKRTPPKPKRKPLASLDQNIMTAPAAQRGLLLESDFLPVLPPPVYQRDLPPLQLYTVAFDDCTRPRSPPSTRDSSEASTEASTPIQEKIQLPSVTTLTANEIAGSIEKSNWWDGYLEDELPPKQQGHILRNLRHQVFSLYRRLFGIVFVTNLAIFVSFLVRRNFNSLHLGQVVVANLFCAVLMRQDHVINLFFNVLCAVPTSWPLSIRRVCARVYHIGGLHSGCAVSGVCWLVLLTAQMTVEFTQHKVSLPTLIITYLIMFILFMILLLAWPSFRQRFHNRFEMSHRFLGWTATALVWVQVVLLINDYRLPGESLAHALRTSAPFWLVVVMTASIVLPWTHLRKVPVRAVRLSDHAVRLYFDYVTPVPGSFTRISKSPLLEWHSFATVPEPGKTGYSLVVSKAGDWTSDTIENLPTKLWVRGVPTCGVLRIVPLFRRLIFVATGSGIGPCAPCILEQRVPIRLLWTSPNVRKTFGDHLVDSILDACPDAVIYDTRVHGKPDMVKMTLRLVQEFKAEAVCIISNQKLTRKLVYGLTSRGIPAFGAIWDS